jgi:hypothetical protein
MARKLNATVFSEVALAICLLIGPRCTPSKTEAMRPSTSDGRARVAAAGQFTSTYAKSRMKAWGLRAAAAGPDCRVLLVTSAIVMDISMAESLHYGQGAYDVYTGGVQRFCRDHGFNGAVYQDQTDTRFPVDGMTQTEADAIALHPCG